MRNVEKVLAIMHLAGEVCTAEQIEQYAKTDGVSVDEWCQIFTSEVGAILEPALDAIKHLSDEIDEWGVQDG